MSEETTQEPADLTDTEAQERIQNMFIALDKIYNLHAPDQTTEPWTCKHCTNCDGPVEFPCPTEKLVLESLGL
jgi:hypothetical protein